MTTIYVKEGTVLPERKAMDEYITEKTLISEALKTYAPLWADSVLDIGAGDGRWGAMAAKKVMAKTVVGVELQYKDMPDEFTDWYSGQDFRTWETDKKFDLIVSNPPYALAEPFIYKAWDLLNNGGQMLFLLRLAFQEGVDRYNNLWNTLAPIEVGVLSRRPSFYGGGTNGTAYGIYYWHKNQAGKNLGIPRKWRVRLILHERESQHE